MTKLDKLRDEQAEKHSLQKWPKQDDEYEGTHVAEGEYPIHYRSSVYQTFQAGWDARDAIANDELAKLKEREAKLVGALREILDLSGRYNFVTDDVAKEQVRSAAYIALADHKRMMEGE